MRSNCILLLKESGGNKTNNLVSFAIGIPVTLFAITLRMVIGMRMVRFNVRRENTFTLVKDGPFIEHEIQIRFSLSRCMTIINGLTLFPPKREPVTAEIKFRYGNEASWLHRGIWKDTGTIETIINDACMKSILVAT